MSVETLGTRQGVAPVSLQDPYADEVTQPFWTAALEGKLLGYKCDACGKFRMPPSPFCSACLSRDASWAPLPGTGSIFSFIVIRHPLRPNMQNAVPYVTAVIELDGTQGAGARMTANVIDADPDKVQVGDKVKVVFDKVSDTFAVPRFQCA
jgi:uncharacterized OB-fold protein